MIKTINLIGQYNKKLSEKDNRENFIKQFLYDNNYPLLYNIKVYFDIEGKYIGEFDISDGNYYPYGNPKYKLCK